MSEKIFMAGSYSIDISPKKGIELAGYPHFPRHNTGVHDPLHSSCIYLANSYNEIAIVSLDLLFFSKKYVKIVRKRIADQTGMSEKNVMICCTHTHSGPWASGRLDYEAIEKNLKPDSEYIEELLNKITDSIIKSRENAVPAKIGTGKGHCGKEKGIGGNRRDSDGASDPEVCVLAIRDLQNNWIACLVNYALHPTLLHADNTLVSADYPGYIREYLEMNKGVKALFIQGPSGNQSTRYFRQGQSFSEAKRIGYEIAKEAARVIDTIKLNENPKLSVKTSERDIELRNFPSKEDAEAALKKAENEYNYLVKINAPYIDIQNANLKILGAEDILGYIIMQERNIEIELLKDEIPVEIQLIEIDDGKLIGFPGEIFVEFGLFIKNISPFENTFIFELTNGCLPGYVYTEEALESGGYETDTSMLDVKTGESFVKTALNLLNN